MASAFGSDNDAWVEDYSHAGGFQGLRWLRISSTSSAKSGSRIGALPVSSSCALANAMQSEMLCDVLHYSEIIASSDERNAGQRGWSLVVSPLEESTSSSRNPALI